jgi:hypothetical protein
LGISSNLDARILPPLLDTWESLFPLKQAVPVALGFKTVIRRHHEFRPFLSILVLLLSSEPPAEGLVAA